MFAELIVVWWCHSQWPEEKLTPVVWVFPKCHLHIYGWSVPGMLYVGFVLSESVAVSPTHTHTHTHTSEHPHSASLLVFNLLTHTSTSSENMFVECQKTSGSPQWGWNNLFITSDLKHVCRNPSQVRTGSLWRQLSSKRRHGQQRTSSVGFVCFVWTTKNRFCLHFHTQAQIQRYCRCELRRIHDRIKFHSANIHSRSCSCVFDAARLKHFPLTDQELNGWKKKLFFLY